MADPADGRGDDIDIGHILILCCLVALPVLSIGALLLATVGALLRAVGVL